MEHPTLGNSTPLHQAVHKDLEKLHPSTCTSEPKYRESIYQAGEIQLLGSSSLSLPR